MSPDTSEAHPIDVAHRIVTIRGLRVLLDADLAVLYGVSAKRLNEQVKRNRRRFPVDFLFQLTETESDSLRSQFATLDTGKRGRHRKYRPWAFTEHGAIMAATVLNSARAVQMTLYVVRAFVRLRQVAATHAELTREMAALKRSIAALDSDTQKKFDQVYEAILGLMTSSKPQ